jgi:hypothetical protein
MVENASYYALRRCPGAAADAWWVNASLQSRGAPRAIAVLLSGRERVELNRDETVEALAWAERIDGFQHLGEPPLRVYPHDPR